MYSSTSYAIKLEKGVLKTITSNLGLKQGCPLSPVLFNIFIDDIKFIFDDSCDPIDFQETKINYFLYADNLVLISLSKEGIQNCLNKLDEYAKANKLTINVDKTKSMVFNSAGRFLKQDCLIGNTKIEQVQTFCYLGFEVKTNGVVSAAVNMLYDKANKAMRPLMGVITRFDIPVKTALMLFHTYISPIALYATENWIMLTDRKLLNFKEETIFVDVASSKPDILHRQFLKFLLGTSKSCPNMAVYGETGEIPLSLKAYRLLLKFWYRSTFMPGESFVKKALLENILLRTKWIKTLKNYSVY